MKFHVVEILKLYQAIWHQGEVVAVDSPEEKELLLSGLVVQQQGKLRVHNRIYKLVFNADLVEHLLCKQDGLIHLRDRLEFREYDDDRSFPNFYSPTWLFRVFFNTRVNASKLTLTKSLFHAFT